MSGRSLRRVAGGVAVAVPAADRTAGPAAEPAEPPALVLVAERKDPVENADGKPTGGEAGAGVERMRAPTSP
jgi:hypothetical protein